jgi:hypothetical protein
MTMRHLADSHLQGSVAMVQGSIVIPTLNIPPGGNSQQKYWASAWVGIDGASCQDGGSLWQTGFYFTIQGNTTEISRELA